MLRQSDMNIPIEMYISVMAGLVIALFLMVGELVALRKQARKIIAHLQYLIRTRRRFTLLAVICGIAVFFFIQPFIVAGFVVYALNSFNPHFSINLVQELKQLF